MTLAQLLASFRVDADDGVAPYGWSDAAIKSWLNEAVREACLRARLLHESARADICQISVTAGTSAYTLHPALYEIDYMAFAPAGDTRRHRIKQISREDLDALHSNWRECTGRPEWAIQGDTGIRLAFTPDAAGTLHTEGFRLPLADMALDADAPEINAAHHIHLVQWVLHRAFSVPDSETVDPNRAALAERAFTAHFGPAVDADLRRTTRQDALHHNTAFWV